MTIDDLVAILLYPAALFTLTIGGNIVCRFALKFSGVRLKSNDKNDSSAKAGRTIGSIERCLIVIGLIARSWEVLIAVIALKTVARYQELDKKIEAEYFLIGSLASILWAVIVTLALMALDATIGFKLVSALQAAVSASDK